MKITLNELRSIIEEVMLEAYGTKTTYLPTAKDMEDREGPRKEKIKFGASPADFRSHSDTAFEEEVEEMAEMPEFQSIDDFLTFKTDNADMGEEISFTSAELVALARALWRSEGHDGIPGQERIRRIKDELTGLGMVFIAREPTRHFRGTGSSMHGASRFAGIVGGGSGMGTNQSGPVGFGIGGGPGAIGGKYDWKSDDPRNLPMGSKRR